MSEHGNLPTTRDTDHDGGGKATRPVTMTDLMRVVWRRRIVPAVGALLGLSAAIAYFAFVAPAYTATSEVALRLPVVNTFTYPGAGADRIINMNVEESLAASERVIIRLSEVTGRPANEIRDSLTIESPVGGQKLRFRYSDSSAEAAARGADAAAAEYLELRRDMYAEQRADLVAGFDEDVARVTEDLEAAQRRVDALPTSDSGAQSPQATAALAELDALRTELAQLREEQARIRTVDVTPGWTTRHADESPASTRDRMLLLLAAGLAGGALAGSVGAVLWESVSRRVRSVADATHSTGLPLIGQIRKPRFRVPAAATDADVRYTSFALAARVAKTPRPLILISPRPDDGRTRLVAGLAMALAASGRNVFVWSMRGGAKQLSETILAERDRFAGPVIKAAVAVPRAHRMTSGAGDDGTNSSHALNGYGAPQPRDEDQTVLIPAVGETAAAGGPLPLPYAGSGWSGGVSASTSESDQGRTAGSDAEETQTFVVPSYSAGEGIQVGTGSVFVGLHMNGVPDDWMVLIDAPAAEFSAQGVHAARDGLAVVVAPQDHTPVVELKRLVERLHNVGSQPVGVIVTRS